MNNEKLIDAIGMLDDKLIVDAKKEHFRISFYIKAIAAVLIIALIPVAVLAGMQFFGRHLYTDSSDPKYKYAFNTSEYKALCEQSLIVDSNPNVVIDPYTLGGTIGSVPIEICYADSNRIVFTTYNGIFVHYRNEHDYIESSYSIKKMDLPGFNQGDKTTIIKVHKNGEYALLMSSQNMSQVGADICYNILDFTTGKLTEIDKDETPKAFEAFELSKNSFIKNHDDLLSSHMASYENSNGDKTDCYISVPKNDEKGYIIGNAQLVEIDKNKNAKTYDLFR